MNAIEYFSGLIKLLLIHFYESLIEFNILTWGFVLVFLYVVISQKQLDKKTARDEKKREAIEKKKEEKEKEKEKREAIAKKKEEKEHAAYLIREEERHKKEEEEWEKIQRERPLFVEHDSLDKAVDLYVRRLPGYKKTYAFEGKSEDDIEKRKLEIINEIREDTNCQTEEERIVSILADYLDSAYMQDDFDNYLEGFNYYHEMLRNFPSIVTDAAEKVHLSQHQDYIQHLKFVKENAIARKVEIAKIKKDRKNPYSVRYANYEKALRMLEEDED